MAKYRYSEHPAIVMINNKPFLRVFEDPFIEESLPKWRQAVDKAKIGPDDKAPSMPEVETNAQGVGIPESRPTPEQIVRSAKWDRDRYIRNLHNHMGRLSHLKHSMLRWIMDRLPGINTSQDAEIAFEEIKTKFVSPSTKDLQDAHVLTEKVAANMEDAGQYVKAEQLRETADIVDKQIVLSRKGYTKFLTEEDVVNFLLKSERGVMIDYLRFYREVLPHEVVLKKKAADELMIFDNYVVLYYDSGVDVFRRIDEEQERRERQKRRDPILCGVIRGCRRLFYICDWIYKDDDLTMEKIEKAIGATGTLPKFSDPAVIAAVTAESDDMARDLESILDAVGDPHW